MTEQLLVKIQNIVNANFAGKVLTFENILAEFIVNNGALESDFAICGEYFAGKLPKDYKDFLLQFNGAIFFKVDDFAGYKFLGCEELIAEDRFQRENYAEAWDNNVIIICSCIADAEHIGIKWLNDDSYELLDCIMGENPSNWAVIDYSIDEFMGKLIDSKGQKFWL